MADDMMGDNIRVAAAAAVHHAAQRWAKTLNNLAGDIASSGCLCDPGKYPRKHEASEFSHHGTCAVSAYLTIARMMTGEAAEQQANARRGSGR